MPSTPDIVGEGVMFSGCITSTDVAYLFFKFHVKNATVNHNLASVFCSPSAAGIRLVTVLMYYNIRPALVDNWTW